ncbi:MAG: thiopurine S-methyltransferase [Acidihalobacter sp.]
MTPEFWLQRWQENRIGFHQSQINVHLEAYWPTLRIPAGATVFVPLCGKSLDMLWLAAQGYRVLGVELSPLAAEAFFEENGLTPEIESQQAFQRYRCGEIEILCGDFFDLQGNDLARVSAVYDRASLIALPPDMRTRYASKLHGLLPSRQPILLITLDYPQDERQGPPFAVTEAEVHELYAGRWQVEKIASRDLRGENDRAQLSRFDEHVFVLR